MRRTGLLLLAFGALGSVCAAACDPVVAPGPATDAGVDSGIGGHGGAGGSGGSSGDGGHGGQHHGICLGSAGCKPWSPTGG